MIKLKSSTHSLHEIKKNAFHGLVYSVHGRVEYEISESTQATMEDIACWKIINAFKEIYIK